MHRCCTFIIYENKVIKDKVLTLARDPKEHINLGLYSYTKPIVSTNLLSALTIQIQLKPSRKYKDSVVVTIDNYKI